MLKNVIFQKLRFASFLRELWTIFHHLYIPVGIGNISCSKMSICSSSLTITSYSICYPLTRGPLHMSHPNLFILKFCSTPLGGWPLPEPIRARVGTRATCFVRNGHPREIPINSTIFKLLLKNWTAFIKNHLGSKFSVKQATLPAFTKQDFVATRGLDPGLSHQGQMLSAGL
jgi:hypothetical protein